VSFVKSANTSVPAARSRDQLEQVLRRYGCSGFGSSQDFEQHRIIVHFVVPDTPAKDAAQIPVRLEVDVPVVCGQLYGKPPYSDNELAQAERVAWRQLILWVDAACSAAAAGVQKMSEAFFAHTVVRGDDGVQRRLVDHFDQLSGGNWRALLGAGEGAEM
jgi:hypothetical protein